MSKKSELIECVRSFAKSNYHVADLSLEDIQQALDKHFINIRANAPVNTDAQEILEEILGVIAVVRLGNDYIAWSIATEESEANALQQKYSNSKYSKIRRELDLDAHWILLFDPNFMFTLEDLYEAHMDLLEMEKKPECVVMKI